MFSALLISLLSLACTERYTVDDIKDTDYKPVTELGRRLQAESPAVARIYSDTTFVLGMGVEQTDIHFQKMNGYVVHVFITRVDLNNPNVSLEVGMPYDMDNTSDFQRQNLTEMAAFADRPHHRVVSIVNADFWDTSTGEIRGPIHRNGKILKETFIYAERLPQQALSFFGITNDGKAVIADSVDYRPMQRTLKEVTGSGVVMVRNGRLSGTEYAGLDPRTVIGYTADNVVYMMTVDGRQNYYSYGMTYEELGNVMIGLGCEWAVNFDGGGSAQMILRHPYADIFEVHNRPSDGSERAVVNAWMAVVDEP